GVPGGAPLAGRRSVPRGDAMRGRRLPRDAPRRHRAGGRRPRARRGGRRAAGAGAGRGSGTVGGGGSVSAAARGPTVVAPWRARRSALLAPRRGLVRSEGLTLVEVLVTLAVASLLLAVVSAVLGSARAAGAAEERAVEPWRALDLAAELLAEEVGLAGHEPYGLQDGATEPAVVVRLVATGHALGVAF